MSMTAEERYQEAVDTFQLHDKQSGGAANFAYYMIEALRAHAHAALEEAARLVVDDDCITCHDEIAPDMREHLADAIRTLREEG